MSWVCGNAPANGEHSTPVVLPERACVSSLNLASAELSEAVLDGENVLISASRMWRECYITITMRTSRVDFGWQCTDARMGTIFFRPNKAWCAILQIWAHKWPKGIPSFVTYTPASECAPPYECEEQKQEQYQPTDFCRYLTQRTILNNDGVAMLEVVLGDEIGWANQRRTFLAGRFRIEESETGVQFILKRADGSEVHFFLATDDTGRTEFQQARKAWDTHDIGVVYQDNSGIPAALSSKSRMVSMNEIPSDKQGLALVEGTRNGVQVFMHAVVAMKECYINVRAHHDCLNLSLQRTNRIQEVLYIQLTDEHLVNALKKSIGGEWIKRHYGMVRDFTPEDASKLSWTRKVAKPCASQLTASQSVASGDNTIGIPETFIEGIVGEEVRYIDENHIYTKVHAQFKDAFGRWQIELTYSDGAVELIELHSLSYHNGYLKAEDILPCWKSVYPDGATGLIARRKYMFD